jgi:hypothetical protein
MTLSPHHVANRGRPRVAVLAGRCPHSSTDEEITAVINGRQYLEHRGGCAGRLPQPDGLHASFLLRPPSCPAVEHYVLYGARARDRTTGSTICSPAWESRDNHRRRKLGCPAALAAPPRQGARRRGGRAGRDDRFRARRPGYAAQPPHRRLEYSRWPTWATRPVSRGRFDRFEERARPRRLVEPITTAIRTNCHAPRRDSPRGRRPLTPALINVQRPDLLVSGPRRRISVADFASWSSAWSRFPKPRPTHDHHREPGGDLNGRDAPPERIR